MHYLIVILEGMTSSKLCFNAIPIACSLPRRIWYAYCTMLT